jgi:mono/diheme cytochrome c family protein
MTLFHQLCAFVICPGLWCASAAAKDAAGEATPSDLDFAKEIWPLLADRCVSCHSAEKQKGDLDLEPLGSFEHARRSPEIWQSVAEQLENNEMPPKKEPQLSPDENERVIRWIRTTLDAIGRERAGDPGPVVLRRLSNAEYSYTLRDITGVESLNPAREFPVDGASGEGFTNSGQGLVMSPALITKYLDAAKEVARHAVLLPEGIRFSPATSSRDWSEEVLQKIRGFYSRFTEAGGEKISLQGLTFDTNSGGRLPLERYLAVTLADREAIAVGRKTTQESAAAHGLNARYLTDLWNELTSGDPSLLLDSSELSGGPQHPTEQKHWLRLCWNGRRCFGNSIASATSGKRMALRSGWSRRVHCLRSSRWSCRSPQNPPGKR